MINVRSVLLAAAAACVLAAPAGAAVITFSSATATFDQATFGDTWKSANMIDGITSGNNGWAIYEGDGSDPLSDYTGTQTAFLTLDTALAGDNEFTFTLLQNFGGTHNLGDFSFGYSTDGAADHESDQTAITSLSIFAASLQTFNIDAGGRIVANGPFPLTDTYTVKFRLNSAQPVTGFFLNVYNDDDGDLPWGGPGEQPTNGNFVVSEFTASAVAVPEPATWALMIMGFAGAGAMLRRRRTALA